MSFAVLIAIGPEPAEGLRVHDLLKALFHYEPGCGLVILVEDGHSATALARVTQAYGSRVVVLPNPRGGRGHDYTGGLTVGILYGMNWARQHSNAEFVLKLDTDSLVIGPFARAVSDRFAQRSELGLLGTNRKFPDGRENV